MSNKAKRYLLILAVLLALAAFVGYQFISQWLVLRDLRAENAALTRELNSLQNNNEHLQQEIDKSSTDSFIERMARQLLGWVKPGEIKIVDGTQ